MLGEAQVTMLFAGSSAQMVEKGETWLKCTAFQFHQLTDVKHGCNSILETLLELGFAKINLIART